MLGMLVAGSCNTIFLKVQDSLKGLGLQYHHAFIQCAVMFVGEMACLLAYFVKIKFLNKKKSEVDQTPKSPG